MLWSKLTNVIDHLNETREKLIGSNVDFLHSKLDHMTRFDDNGYQPSNGYSSTPPNSCFECTSLQLGYLLKGMQSISLLPRPQQPFSGLSYDSLQHSIETIRTPDFEFNHCSCDSLGRLIPDLLSSLSTNSQKIIEDEMSMTWTCLIARLVRDEARILGRTLFAFLHNSVHLMPSRLWKVWFPKIALAVVTRPRTSPS